MGYDITPNIAGECCYYLLSLNHRGGDIMDYNWATHAYNYWVCDGIVGEGQYNRTWGVARALHEQIRLEDYASNTVPSFGPMLETPRARWFCLTDPIESQMTARETTSLFLASKISGLLPSGMFHQADQLRVLKLCRCTFSFSTPPFHRCQNLRFLGLDSCIDQQKLSGQNESGTAMTMEIFQRLWVLDVCHTDWELDERGEEQVYPYIREVHINNGRIWRGKFAWRQLQNLQKLRVIKPTSSWETGKSDEFITMVNLELLDMTGNNYIQVLPRLSDATGLKTLVLDGCVGLEHVGPEGLPPSLESFSLDVGAGGDHEKDAKLSRVSLAGCARMEDFRVRGCFPNLQELDLSSTAIKMLDLKDMNAQHLQRILLVECQKLRSIAWPAMVMQQLRLLCIDTREGEMVVSQASHDSLVSYVKDARFCRVLISIMDMRFLQSLVDLFRKTRWDRKMNICFSCKEDKRGDGIDIEKMRNIIYCSGQLVCSHVQETALMSKQAGRTYQDISMGQLMTTRSDDKGAAFQPENLHLEIGMGVSDVTDEISAQGSRAIPIVINQIQSLYVHENSFITTVIPLQIILFGRTEGLEITWSSLKRCLVERCPKLDTVFTINYDHLCFENLETIWVAHLLMARSIWSRGTSHFYRDRISFNKLRVIHLRFCPRLTFVLPLAWFYTLHGLETLEIVCCADLKLVFPVEERFLEHITAAYANGMLEFPELKRLYLYHLSNLQQICEAKMLAPKLETIYVRGCWGLRRLPATDGCHRDRPVAVDCEKDWWGNLEWDGLNVGHHPSLFAPRHSKYYKRKLLKGTVLR